MATTSKKLKPTTLPDDLLLECLSRVSRLYYPTLSLVSKGFRSILASPELYKARSLLNRSETCLYVCLRNHEEHHLFTLCQKPNQTHTSNKKKKSSVYVLANVSTTESPPPFKDTNLVAVGSKIYNIEVEFRIAPTSRVSILDCMSHTWHECPSLHTGLMSLSARVLDQKIYVAGCYRDADSFKNSFQVFDTRTQISYPLPAPSNDEKDANYYATACIDGKFHTVTDHGVIAYNPKENRWDQIIDTWKTINLDSYCVIDNVLYCCYKGIIKWYDIEVNKWRYLDGLYGLPEFSDDDRVTFADYGGKMAVLWFQKLPSSYRPRKKVWCAVIALDKTGLFEIWGNVEWFGHVLTVPLDYDFKEVLAVTL